MPTWIERFLPPNPIARRLSFQSILFAVGQGAFLTGSAVFFTHIVGLTASQVGLGLTIAGLASFAFAVPLGRFADKVGTKRLWAVSSSIDAGGIVVVAGIGIHPAARAAERYLATRTAHPADHPA